MIPVYLCSITEYEAGWGQRPDGYYLSLDKENLEKYIKSDGNSGSYELYWRCSPIEEVFCEPERYETLKADIEKKKNKGVIWVKNKEKYKLFKQV